ncbi:hypothetical protein GGR57DRAFT_77693 [Xylariaceae sp. FL1272]|nr:hypothetical protein GGR57DRAFT_77693 [Xylariaceae sp. FL1272]
MDLLHPRYNPRIHHQQHIPTIHTSHHKKKMKGSRILSPEKKVETLQEIERALQSETTRHRIYGQLNGWRLEDHFRQRSISPSEIDEFVRFCKECLPEFEGLGAADTQNLIRELFAKLDSLFFFGTLSRKFKKYGDDKETPWTQVIAKPIGTSHCVTSEVIELHVLDENGSLPVFGQGFGVRHDILAHETQFGELLNELAHEMCRVYLWRFTGEQWGDIESCVWQMMHFIFFELSIRHYDVLFIGHNLDEVIDEACEVADLCWLPHVLDIGKPEAP